MRNDIRSLRLICKNILLIAMITFTHSFIFSMETWIDEIYEEDIDISDVVQVHEDYKKYLDESVKALEECHQADGSNVDLYFEPCSKVLSIMNHPAHHIFRSQAGETGKSIKDLVEQYGEYKVGMALYKKVGIKMFKQLEKQRNLLRSCDGEWGKLNKTRKKMRSEIDLRKFNAQLPRVLGDLCERTDHWGVASECKKIQEMFQRRDADLRGEYSPFPSQNDVLSDSVVYGNVVVDPKYLAWDVGKLCRHLDLSQQTTAELARLTMQGYKGNGKCEEGPIIDQGQELENDRQINALFPEILKNHCDLHPDSDDCASLRRMIYAVKNPSKRPYLIDVLDYSRSRYARDLIFQLFRRDRVFNKETDCMDKLGKTLSCATEDEVYQYVQDFKKLLHNETMVAEAQHIHDNFQSLDDFQYYIAQDGLVIIRADMYTRFIKKEQAFDCSSDLEKVLAKQGIAQEDIKKKYTRGRYVARQPFFKGDRRDFLHIYYGDDYDDEKAKELLHEVNRIFKKNHKISRYKDD